MSRTLQALLFVVLLTFAGALIAKGTPKVTVKVHVEEEITNLNNGSDVGAIGTAHSLAQYFNVTVTPGATAPAGAATAAAAPTDAAAEPLVNDGKWCLKSQANQRVQLVKDGTYEGELNGTFVHLLLPQAKGKPVDVSFSIFDRKWRSRLDIR